MDYGSTVEKASSKIDFGLFETHKNVGDSTKLDLLLEGPRQTKCGFGTSEIVQETLAFEDQTIVSPINFENLVATEMENAWLFTFAASDSIESLGEGQLGINLTLHHFQLGALFHNVQGCTEEATIKKPILVMFRSNHSRRSKLYLRFEVIWK
ncbi:hypothetical protein TIFTF001_033636 [Ficus carica]|uniref:Uncharacterized protein n=1 Tax=Ficus carica TaxID=3494 RepID=A0AA88DYV4_FICCA|nr:hypothetical protein TIFTF001_033636 [Ficus carica]